MKGHYKNNCILVNKCREYCCEKLQDPSAIAENGPFPMFRVSFAFQGSKNKGFFCVEHQSGNVRWLRFVVARPGYDMVVSHYMKKGTNEELAAYLSDASTVAEFVSDFQGLSDSLDDKLD